MKNLIRFCFIVIVAGAGCSPSPKIEMEAPTLFGKPFAFVITNSGSEPFEIEDIVLNGSHKLTRVIHHLPPLPTVIGVQLGEGESITVDNNYLSEQVEDVVVVTSLGSKKFEFE